MQLELNYLAQQLSDHCIALRMAEREIERKKKQIKQLKQSPDFSIAKYKRICQHEKTLKWIQSAKEKMQRDLEMIEEAREKLHGNH